MALPATGHGYLLGWFCSQSVAFLSWCSTFVASPKYWGLHCTFDFNPMASLMHCPVRGFLFDLLRCPLKYGWKSLVFVFYMLVKPASLEWSCQQEQEPLGLLLQLPFTAWKVEQGEMNPKDRFHRSLFWGGVLQACFSNESLILWCLWTCDGWALAGFWNSLKVFLFLSLYTELCFFLMTLIVPALTLLLVSVLHMIPSGTTFMCFKFSVLHFASNCHYKSG